MMDSERWICAGSWPLVWRRLSPLVRSTQHCWWPVHAAAPRAPMDGTARVSGRPRSSLSSVRCLFFPRSSGARVELPGPLLLLVLLGSPCAPLPAALPAGSPLPSSYPGLLPPYSAQHGTALGLIS